MTGSWVRAAAVAALAAAVVQAYPENDQIWEQWGLIGCTLPASQLGGVTSPPYVNCP